MSSAMSSKQPCFIARKFCLKYEKIFSYLTLKEIETLMELSPKILETLKDPETGNRGLQKKLFLDGEQSCQKPDHEELELRGAKYSVTLFKPTNRDIGADEFNHKRFYFLVGHTWVEKVTMDSHDQIPSPLNPLAMAHGIIHDKYPIEYMIYNGSIEFYFFEYPLEVVALVLWRNENAQKFGMKPDTSLLYRQKIFEHGNLVSAEKFMKTHKTEIEAKLANYRKDFVEGKRRGEIRKEEFDKVCSEFSSVSFD